MRDSPERQYTREWLQYERQQPMYDESINDFYKSIFVSSPVHKDTTTIDEQFLSTFEQLDSTLIQREFFEKNNF